MDVDKGGELREEFKAELIAAVLDGDFLSPFSKLEIAVPFNEGDVIEVGRFAEMPLLEEFQGVLSIFAKKDVGLPAAAEIGEVLA